MSLLTLHNRRRWGDLRDRIAVAMDDLPGAVFAAEDMGDPHSEGGWLVSPLDKDLTALDPYSVAEVTARTTRHLFDATEAPAMESRRGELRVLADAVPTGL